MKPRMNYGHAIRYARDPEFRRGFNSGFATSINAPANRERMRRSFRISMYTAIVGSLALQWLQRSRAEAGGYTLSNAQTFGASVAGAFGAVAVVSLLRWAWRSLQKKPAV